MIDSAARLAFPPEAAYRRSLKTLPSAPRVSSVKFYDSGIAVAVCAMAVGNVSSLRVRPRIAIERLPVVQSA